MGRQQWIDDEKTRGAQPSKGAAHDRDRGAEVPNAAGEIGQHGAISAQTLTPASIMALQRTIGNAAVSRLLRQSAATEHPDLAAQAKRALGPGLLPSFSALRSVSEAERSGGMNEAAPAVQRDDAAPAAGGA